MTKTIYLDFDGTLVEFAWPKIGVSNLRWKPVLERLMDRGWNLILNTARVHDTEYDSFSKAHGWLINEFGHRKFEWTNEKIHPEDWNPTPESTVLFIDDIALGIPLMSDSRKRPLVHWGNVKRDLEKQKLI